MASGKGRQNGRGRTPPLRIAGESVQRGGGVRSPRPTANMETGRCGHRPLQVQDKECGESGRRGRRPLRVQNKECDESGRRGRRPLRVQDKKCGGPGGGDAGPYGCRTRSAVNQAVRYAGPYGCRTRSAVNRAVGDAGPYGCRTRSAMNRAVGDAGPYGCRTRSAVNRAVGDAGPYEALQVGRATARVAPTVGYCWCGGPGGGCAGAWKKQGEPGSSSCFVFCAFLFCVFQRQLSLWKNMATVPGPTWAPVTGS